MLRKTFSALIFIVLLTGILTSTFNIQPVKASGTIYIRSDGSIDPPTAPITTTDNVTYTFTGNINDHIVVERNNTIINGADYILQGPGSGTGIDISFRRNITIKNTNIKNFDYGVYLYYSSNNTVSGNNITNNNFGVLLDSSSNNMVSGNNITNNEGGVNLFLSSNNMVYGNNITNNNVCGVFLWFSSNNNITNNDCGIQLSYSSNNMVSGNNITNNNYGIYLYDSSNNNITGNNITNNDYGVWLDWSSNNNISGNNITNNNYNGVYLQSSSNNRFYHNNFINNTDQVGLTDSFNNTWDNGCEGNYWSDYNGTDLDGDGIGDTPYVIDINNIDRYPLMKPYAGPHDVGIRSFETSKTVVGQGYNVSMTATIINYGEQTETFNVTIQANSTTLYTLTQTLTSRNSTTVTFTWNTTDWAKGNYTISAYVAPVPGEIDLSDNNSTDGWVFVTMQGDVDGDRDVDIYDVIKITGIYGSKRGDPQFNPNSDLDDDGEIKIYDVIMCTSRYGKYWQL